MNKSLFEIIAEMLGLKDANPNLATLTTTSKTSIWRQVFETVAFAIWNFQEATNLHLQEIEDKIRNQKVSSLKWYRTESLRFQYGFDLINENDGFRPDYYDVETDSWIIATDEQVENSKVVKYAAVGRNIVNNRALILIKIATEENEEIVPVSDNVGIAFTKFIEEIQPTGDVVQIINYKPDILFPQFKVCYDPLILLPNGQSILLGNVFPVQEAIRKFMKNLPFNGELSVQKLEEIILNVTGVVDLQKLQVESKWIVPTGGDAEGYGLFQPIQISKIPKSGHFKIENWSGIQYIIKIAEE